MDENNNNMITDIEKDFLSSDLDSESGVNILYITFGIVIFMLLIWIIVLIFSNEDSVKILGEMTQTDSQIPPISDNQN